MNNAKLSDLSAFFILYLSQLLSKTIYEPKKENFYFESEEKMITFEQNIPALFRFSYARAFLGVMQGCGNGASSGVERKRIYKHNHVKIRK